MGKDLSYRVSLNLKLFCYWGGWKVGL